MRKPGDSPSLNELMTTVMAETPYLPEADVTVNVFHLTDDDRNEVLAFLAERPVQTVCLAGFIRDNGLVSPHNRGSFYGCRNSEGRLEGVALIGHATLIEARTTRAMQEFALVAQTYQHTHMILGEKEKIEQFWNHYADDGQELRLACRELLFEVRRAMQIEGPVAGLRHATLEDLDQILPVQASMAECESGINPLEVDAEGFRARCAPHRDGPRLGIGRRWPADFKADSRTPR